MNSEASEDLARLKAVAGERQERDSSNNPQIPDEKVPKNSAASKTSSALADYAKGLQAESDTIGGDQDAMPSTIPGKPTSLRDEPELIARIGSRAQDATSESGATHFTASAQKLGKAYEQDQEWISQHPDQGNSRV